MTNQIHLYLIETNPERAKTLRAELAMLPQVNVLQNYAEAVDASGGLDAVVVPLMSAMEWGAIKPPVPLHQTQVVKMPDYEVARGRPSYAIPGVATSPDESLTPIDTTRLVLRESFKAIYRFLHNWLREPMLREIPFTPLVFSLVTEGVVCITTSPPPPQRRERVNQDANAKSA